MSHPTEKVLKLATLVFPVRGQGFDREVMLARKTGKIGAGFLNGWGGGVESNETIEDAAVREFHEETGGSVIHNKWLEKVAVCNFKNNLSDGGVFVCEVHVFITAKWIGNIHSTSEMENPTWYLVRQLYQQKLMPADYYWLPNVLRGEKGIVEAEYSPGQKSTVGRVVLNRAVFLEEG